MTAAAPPARGHDPHTELATALGTRISQQLWKMLPRLTEALGPLQQKKAWFNAKVTFVSTPDGPDVEIAFTSDIPIPNVRSKLGWLEGQLSLLPPDPVPQQPQQPGLPQQPQPIMPPVAAPVPAPAAPPTAMDARTAAMSANRRPAVAGRIPEADEGGVT